MDIVFTSVLGLADDYGDHQNWGQLSNRAELTVSARAEFGLALLRFAGR